MEPSLTLRYAGKSDASILFEWRNAPDVRRNFVNQEPVSLEQHLSWLESTLSREDRVLLIGELANGIPVGVVRFDIDCNNAQAEISITIAPPAQGKGYAAPLLRGAISTLNQDEKKRIAILTLIAKVRHDNVPSISCFMRVGFQFTREDAEFKYLSRSLHQG